jgi:hypothetical protein
MASLKIKQVIGIDNGKAKVLGMVRYSKEGLEYFVRTDGGKYWLELDGREWKLWKEVSLAGNPVVKMIEADFAVQISDVKVGDFIIKEQGVWEVVESVGETEETKVGEMIRWWEGKRISGKEWPLFAVERCQNGEISLWYGKYVKVEV